MFTEDFVTSYHLSDNVVDTRDVTIKTCVALTFARILYFNAWDCFVSLSFHILRLKVRRIEKDSICRKKQLTQRGVSGAPSVEALWNSRCEFVSTYWRAGGLGGPRRGGEGGWPGLEILGNLSSMTRCRSVHCATSILLSEMALFHICFFPIWTCSCVFLFRKI